MTTPDDTPDAPPQDPRRQALRDQARRVTTLLRTLGDDLELMILALEINDPASAKEFARCLPDLRYWLKQTNDTEKEFRNADLADTNAAATDLAAARAEVRCRLDRLRDCRTG